MTTIDDGQRRIGGSVANASRRQAMEILALVAASLAFIFALAIAFGFITG